MWSQSLNCDLNQYMGLSFGQTSSKYRAYFQSQYYSKTQNEKARFCKKIYLCRWQALSHLLSSAEPAGWHLLHLIQLQTGVTQQGWEVPDQHQSMLLKSSTWMTANLSCSALTLKWSLIESYLTENNCSKLHSTLATLSNLSAAAKTEEPSTEIHTIHV